MSALLRTSLVLLLALSSGCAARLPQLGPPRPELEAAALRLALPPAPAHLIFDWRLVEREARFGGQGVARVDAPHRARLDLFGPRGEAYLAAVLWESELRLPPGVSQSAVPPPELLWASVGVFRPPSEASLTGSDSTGTTIRLGYERPGERWLYQLQAGRLEYVDYHGPGGRRRVELRGEAGAFPVQTLFRDWGESRELLLTVTQVEYVEGFPADIWTLGAP
jgi:hypothetical protein